MALQASREVVIEAPPEAVMDVLADAEAMPSYLAPIRRADIIDRYEDGRPHHVRMVIKFLGRISDNVLEYRWGPECLVWDAERITQRYAQHVEYTLRSDFERTSTAVRVDITVELDSLIPDYFIRRAGDTMLDAWTAGLRKHVLGSKRPD